MEFPMASPRIIYAHFERSLEATNRKGCAEKIFTDQKGKLADSLLIFPIFSREGGGVACAWTWNFPILHNNFTNRAGLRKQKDGPPDYFP
jgi:hypothetical protein